MLGIWAFKSSLSYLRVFVIKCWERNEIPEKSSFTAFEIFDTSLSLSSVPMPVPNMGQQATNGCGLQTHPQNFSGSSKVKTISIIILRYYLPFKNPLFYQCAAEILRGYMICGISID